MSLLPGCLLPGGLDLLPESLILTGTKRLSSSSRLVSPFSEEPFALESAMTTPAVIDFPTWDSFPRRRNHAVMLSGGVEREIRRKGRVEYYNMGGRRGENNEREFRCRSLLVLVPSPTRWNLFHTTINKREFGIRLRTLTMCASGFALQPPIYNMTYIRGIRHGGLYVSRHYY